MNKNVPRSPLTGNTNLTQVKAVPVSWIINKYKEKLNINVAGTFSGLEQIILYRCNDSGYEFYYPFNLMGNAVFYENIARNDWYYLPWKWEHDICSTFTKDGMKVLEVGAGKGNFLKKLCTIRNIDAVGLELNPAVTDDGSFRLINQSVEEHSLNNADKYDMVCSFQVLEHLSNIDQVLRAMTTCLKPGGLLVISVPDNDGFIGKDMHPASVLNMPPHHVGRWNERSLRKICDYFPLELISIHNEPLQYIHAGAFQHTLLSRYFGDTSFFRKIYWKLRVNKVVETILLSGLFKVRGHSILALYRRSGD